MVTETALIICRCGLTWSLNVTYHPCGSSIFRLQVNVMTAEPNDENFFFFSMNTVCATRMESTDKF